MNAVLISFVAKPILRRIGTAAAVALAAQGIPEETVNQVITGLGALGLVSLDLYNSWRDKK